MTSDLNAPLLNMLSTGSFPPSALCTKFRISLSTLSSLIENCEQLSQALDKVTSSNLLVTKDFQHVSFKASKELYKLFLFTHVAPI